MRINGNTPSNNIGETQKQKKKESTREEDEMPLF